MSTGPEEFRELAAELFAEFAGFAQPAQVVELGAFDYAQQQAVERVQAVRLIRMEYGVNQFDGAMVRVGDVKFLGELAGFEWEPQPDNAAVIMEGVRYQVRRFEKDAAGAVGTIHARRL